MNLSLVVEPKDSTGYHPVHSVIQAVGLFDELTLESADALEWIVEGQELPPDNTLSKTLRLVGEACVVPPLRIHLVKRIPARAGLGGGSSDAAGLLLGLDRFLAAPIPDSLKNEIAAAVGMDVPFFLTGGQAIAKGYGHVVEPVGDPLETWFALAMPEVDVSTSEAYAKLDELDFVRPTGLPIGYNDFERVAPCESLDLLERMKVLGAARAMLCGSGAAVFGQFADRNDAVLATRDLAREGAVWTAVAPSLPRDFPRIEVL